MVEHELIEFHLPQHFIEQHEWQSHLIGDVRPLGVSPREQEFERQLFDFALG